MNIIKKILELKKKQNAIILVHNYQPPEIQDIGDFVGDSLELARKSAEIECDVIVFCGVHFMAETAKIFNPEKKVIIPDLYAGCPMADMITPERLRELKAQHPNAAVVSYVNSNVELKAMSDICCTSANGVKVVSSVKNKEVIFIPDRWLGSYVGSQLKRKKIWLCSGYCPTHMVFSKEGINKLKKQYPQALILVHPECRMSVQEIADAICSTSQMLRFAKKSKEKKFIIATEIGMLWRLKKDMPNKEFIPGNPNAICPGMKVITLEKVRWALENMKFEIKIKESTRLRALKAIRRMINL